MCEETEELDEIILGNGDTLAERIEEVKELDFEEIETSTIEEVRDEFGL